MVLTAKTFQVQSISVIMFTCGSWFGRRNLRELKCTSANELCTFINAYCALCQCLIDRNRCPQQPTVVGIKLAFFFLGGGGGGGSVIQITIISIIKFDISVFVLV